MRAFVLPAILLTFAACSNPTPPPGAPYTLKHERSLGAFNLPVWQVAFSPDGRMLAGAGADGAITIWSWPDGAMRRTLRHNGGATGLAFSPDGAHLATSGYDAAARIWRLADGQPVRKLDGATGTLWTIAWSPDGKRIAAAGEDKHVRVWDAGDGKAKWSKPAHDLNVWSVRFSADSARVVSGSFDRLAKVWQVDDGAEVGTLRAHTEAIVEVAASPDGRHIATAGDDSRVRVWRASDGALLHTFEAGEHQYAVTFSPDSSLVASGGRERGAIGTLLKQLGMRLGAGGDTVRMWRVADGALAASLKSRDDVHSVVFSPDGQWLATSGEGPTVNVWRLAPAAR
jgi:WD40 repeat protein